MSGFAKSEWIPFRVGKRDDWGNKCEPFPEIFHVTHLATAAQVLSDGAIKAGLVFDKSKLNQDRILVTWLSPNDWWGAGGFRYGNVRFSFDWKTLIEGKQAYWVESIAYGVPAARILLSEKDYSSTLSVYDPSIGDGPWWYDKSDDSHFRNGSRCLEIMYEGSLGLEKVATVDFVKHHPRYCAVNSGSCPDKGRSEDSAAGKFLATIVCRRLHPTTLKWAHDGEPRSPLIQGFSRLRTDLTKSCNGIAFEPVSKLSKRTGTALARAVLSAYADEDQNELKKLAKLFASADSVIAACCNLVAESFGLDDPDGLVP